MTDIETPTVKMYYVSFMAKNEVVVASPDSEEDTLAKVTEGLQASFGDAYEILEFHLAEQTELKDFDLRSDGQTIN